MTLPIVHLCFPNQYLMNASLLRFQEYHESPKFRHKLFNLEEYMDWYAGTNKGKFTYFEDWVGCNFPGHILTVFEASYSNKEAAVRDAVADVFESLGCRTHKGLPRETDFYIIGTSEDTESEALDHEIVHGLYYLNESYARKVNRLCRLHSKSLSGEFHAHLGRIGYNKRVFNDETNAYMTTGLSPACKIPKRDLPMKEFRKLFLDHFGFDVSQLAQPEWQKANIHTVHMRAPRTYGKAK